MAGVQAQHTRSEKETIHSGHFMVSHFEAEAQDDYDDLAVPVPEEEPTNPKISGVVSILSSNVRYLDSEKKTKSQQQLSIETSLTKLFKCMTLAYRQKLTSPKWNRFKGIKLRWKDKIRLNNVIWRCWHMQFIKKQNTLVCQFASPLDVDTHVKPETTILEGKYWKRRAEAVKAEYKKWRMFHITRLLGKGDTARDTLSDMEALESLSQCGDMAGSMLMDEDYITFMSDTLFSTITSHQPFAFPDTREIARGASLADFIQPSLGPLQPNLDDFMDTLEPLQELLSASRLPPVPEETALTSEEQMYRGSLPLEHYGAHYLPAASALSATQMHVQGSSAVLALSVQEVMQPVKNEQAQFECSYRPEPAPAQYRAPYEQHAATSVSDAHLYPIIKSSPYHQKLPHQDTTYTKPYAPTVIPTPSQTAPETVSLLQQPISAQKMNAAVLANRQSYQRDRPSRARATQYSNQQTSHYPYAPPVQLQNTVYDTRSNQRTGQVQYLQPLQMDTYKSKNMPSGSSNQRSFKLPSPPLTNINPQQSGAAQTGQAAQAGQAGRQHSPAVAAAAATAAAAAAKENFRSNSLPVGAHLNADWSISTLATPNDASPRVEGVVSVGGLVRVRARSTSGGEGEGCGAGGAAGTGRRVPPPLASVNSEPSLPHNSVMLAQLLTHQHSQSMYKLSCTSAGAAGGSEEPSPRCSNEALSSPQPRTLPSPTAGAVKEIISPLHGVSPAGSPPESPGSPPEPRRATHLHAEQKRRYNIKNGFDTLQSLIPHLNNNPAAKVSKAAMLQKGAEYIKQLKAERNQINEEMENLRQQITSLNNSISNCHSLLPATGAPVSRARAGRLREMFARHVAHRTMHNWKYWLFSVVGGMLVESFSNCVSNSSGGDLVRTTLLWAEQHCSLVEMRPAVLSSLRVLCTSTDILSNPERLPEEARAAVTGASNIKTEPS